VRRLSSVRWAVWSDDRLNVIARITVISAKPLGLKLPRKKVRFFGVAANTGCHPVIWLISTAGYMGDEMIYLPSPACTDNTVVLERQRDPTVKTLPFCPVIYPINVFVCISHDSLCPTSLYEKSLFQNYFFCWIKNRKLFSVNLSTSKEALVIVER
jgi:hypothetical protein